MKKLVKIGTSELGENAVIYASKEDFKLLKNLGIKFSEKPIACAGGILIERSDGKVRLNLTFESIFEEKKDLLRKKVHDALFRR